MKYLKKFNEELDPDTYTRASMKLREKGHHIRSKSLIDWSSEKKWEELVNTYSKYGEFNADFGRSLGKEEETTIDILSIPCYLQIISRVIKKHNQNRLYFNLIPKTLKDHINLQKYFKKEGQFFPYFSISFFIDSPDVIRFRGDNYFTIRDTHIPSETVRMETRLSDRISANKFIKLLGDVMTNGNSEYPTSNEDITLYQSLQRDFLIDTKLTDTGVELEDIYHEFMKIYSANDFYKN